MAKYKLTQHADTVIDTESPNTFLSVNNPRYKAWIAEGNTPDAADPVTISQADKDSEIANIQQSIILQEERKKLAEAKVTDGDASYSVSVDDATAKIAALETKLAEAQALVVS